MLVYNYVPFFSRHVPLALQHGREDVFLFGDLVAPFFLFIMGVSLALSVHKRMASGSTQGEILRHVLKRSFLLIIIGLFIDETLELAVGGRFGLTWGVLETLGASYLISYLVIRRSTTTKFLVSAILLGAHLVLSAFPWYLDILRSAPHGGPLSTLSWAPITIIGLVCGEQLSTDRSHYERFLLAVALPLLILGLVMSPVDPLNKVIVSSSYAIFSAGASALFFLFLYYLIETRKLAFIDSLLKPLRDFGVSALLAWVLQYVLAAYFVYYFHVHGKLAPYNGVTLTIGLILVVWLLVHLANRKGLRLTL